MAITFVNAASIENQSSATYSVILTWAQTAGDLIQVGIWTSGLTQAITSVTDTKGNYYFPLYTNKNASNALGGQNVMYVCVAAAAAASSANTVKVIFGTSQTTATVAVATYNSDTGFGLYDLPGTTSTGHSTSATLSETTLNANDLCLGWITTGSGGVTTVTSGSTAVLTATNKKALLYAIRTTTGAQAFSATVSSTNDYWVVGVGAIYKTTNPNSIANLVQQVQSTGQLNTESTTITTLRFDPTNAGNALLLCLTCSYHVGQTVTITDNKSNTWNSVASVINSTNAANSYVFLALNVAAATTSITVTYGTAVQGHCYSLTHLFNIATSSAVDGTPATSSTTTGPNPAAGSITTVSNGDIIFNYGTDVQFWDAGQPNTTDVAPMPGFTWLGCDIWASTYLQAMVQTTAGAISPRAAVTGTGTDTFNCISFALKTATSGSDPFASAIGIRHQYRTQVNTQTPTIIVPCQGNLLIVGSDFSTSQATMTPSDSLFNAYTYLTPINSGYPQWSYVANANTSHWLHVNTLGTGATSLMIQSYDVVNAASSPYDSTVGQQGASVSNTANANMDNLPSITPSTSNGLVVVLVGDGTGPITGLVDTTPAGAIMDTIIYNGATDLGSMNDGDGHAHYYNPNTSAIHWCWSINTPAPSLPEGSSGVSIAFKGAASTTLNALATFIPGSLQAFTSKVVHSAATGSVPGVVETLTSKDVHSAVGAFSPSSLGALASKVTHRAVMSALASNVGAFTSKDAHSATSTMLPSAVESLASRDAHNALATFVPQSIMTETSTDRHNAVVSVLPQAVSSDTAIITLKAIASFLPGASEALTSKDAHNAVGSFSLQSVEALTELERHNALASFVAGSLSSLASKDAHSAISAILPSAFGSISSTISHKAIVAFMAQALEALTEFLQLKAQVSISAQAIESLASKDVHGAAASFLPDALLAFTSKDVHSASASFLPQILETLAGKDTHKAVVSFLPSVLEALADTMTNPSVIAVTFVPGSKSIPTSLDIHNAVVSTAPSALLLLTSKDLHQAIAAFVPGTIYLVTSKDSHRANMGALAGILEALSSTDLHKANVSSIAGSVFFPGAQTTVIALASFQPSALVSPASRDLHQAKSALNSSISFATVGHDIHNASALIILGDALSITALAKLPALGSFQMYWIIIDEDDVYDVGVIHNISSPVAPSWVETLIPTSGSPLICWVSVGYPTLILSK